MRRANSISTSIALITVLCSAVVTALPAVASGAPQSDDFFGAGIDTTTWQIIDPIGDATFMPTGTNVLIHVPGRVEHTLWNTCSCAPQLLQSVSDTDFEVEVKFESIPSAQYQVQGIVIREDDDTFIRFDVHFNGLGPRIFAGYVNGVNPPSTKLNQTISEIPAYLRVTRTGDLWDYAYSYDGQNWTTAVSFTRTIVVGAAGVFAANENPIEYDTPEFVANIDYFFNTASPITPEDGGSAAAPTPPVIDLWYGDSQAFGSWGEPQDQINIVGNTWAHGDVGSLSYTVNGGPSTALSVGPNASRLVGFGDFNVDIPRSDLVPGINTVVITAADTLGETSDTTVTVDYTDGVVAALPLTAAFTSAAEISDAADVVDGKWGLVAGGVRTDPLAAGYQRLLAIGDRSWSPDYEISAPFTVHSDVLGVLSSVEFIIGWQGHSGSGQPQVGGMYQALARIRDITTAPVLEIVKGGGGTVGQTAITFSTDELYMIRLRSQTLGSDSSRVSVRVWRAADPEPLAWDVDTQVPTRSGSLLLMADYADVTFGDVDVTATPRLGHFLTTDVTGNGSVIRTPNYTQYADSAVVDLSAVPDSTYAFLGWGGDLSGRENPVEITMTGDVALSATFVPGVVSDDFNDPSLNTGLWRWHDPVGDAQYRLTGTNLEILLPGGVSHDLWSDCNCAPRLLQPSADTDFTLETAFGASGQHTYQSQGIVIQEDDATLVRVDVVYEDDGCFVFAGHVDGGSATSRISHTPAAHPNYLRVERTGDSWRVRYSESGVVWTTAGTFTHAIEVTEVGVFAANAAGSEWDTPAYVANIDYFFNTAAPIVPEDAGAAAAPTPPDIVLWYGDAQETGHLGVPEQWYNVLGCVRSSEPITTLSYTVNGGPSIPLNMGPDTQRLDDVGDFIIEVPYSDLVVGANTVEITAVDASNDQTVKNLNVNFTGGTYWNVPTTADWGAATQVTDIAHVVTGRWDIVPSGVRTAVGATGYDRAIVVGDHRWITDYEVEGPITVHDGNLGGLAGIGFVLGWQGHEGTAQPKIFPPYQTAAWVRDVPGNPRLQFMDDENTRGELPISFSTETTYMLKVRSEDIGGAQRQVSMKLWEDGTTEPSEWMMTDTFAERNGAVLLVAHFADVTFGNVTVTPLSPFPQYSVEVAVEGNGNVVRSPSKTLYVPGEQVVLTATPDEGWGFNGWSGGLSGSASIDTITVTGNTNVSASFGIHTVDITINGAGTVDVAPAKQYYLPGEAVVLTADPYNDMDFQGWSGDHSGTSNPDTVVVDSSLTITALFAYTPTGIGDTPAITELFLGHNAPNPFTAGTYLQFSLPSQSDVEIEVYDAAGRRVYAEKVRGAAPGWHRKYFDGRDSAGRSLPSGVYFYRVRTRHDVATRKMVIVR